jgi:hypothetical protein
LFQFEKLLYRQSSWEEGSGLPDDLESQVGRELCKAFQVIQELRRLARPWQEDDGSLKRYFLALLFEAVFRIIADGRDSPTQPPPIWRRAHALLRTAMLIKAL